MTVKVRVFPIPRSSNAHNQLVQFLTLQHDYWHFVKRFTSFRKARFIQRQTVCLYRFRRYAQLVRLEIVLLQQLLQLLASIYYYSYINISHLS